MKKDATDRPGSAREEATDRRTEGSRPAPTTGVGAGVEVVRPRREVRPSPRAGVQTAMDRRAGAELRDTPTDGGSAGRLRVEGRLVVVVVVGGRSARGGGGGRGAAAGEGGDSGGGGGRGREAGCVKAREPTGGVDARA